MTKYDRNNLSSLVSENLPDFVSEDYPKFVVFLEEYYKWLESRDNSYFAPLSLNGLIDIDRTVDDYIKHFKSYIFPKFPERFKSVKGDELDTRLTIKKIRDFYQSKGTKDSIKFLIRLLFDVYSEIYVPSEDIFVASGGRWYQPYVVRCIDTNPRKNSQLRNLKVTFHDTNGLQVGTGRITELKQFSRSGKQIIEFDISEFVGSSPYPGTIRTKTSSGEDISINLINMVDEITVLNGGSNYSLDDPITITTTEGYNGTGAKASVSSITKDGAIRSIRIDDPGLFYYPLGGTYVHYTIDINSETGTGASGFDLTTSSRVKRPGVYQNNDGQLSSTEKLQDNFRYQIHSYVVRTEANLGEYKNTLKDLVHPAGKLLLGDYFVYRTDGVTLASLGYALGGLNQPYFANYFPYTIATLTDGATTEIGAFGVLPSDFDLRSVHTNDTTSTGVPELYVDYFPYGYDGSTGYYITDVDIERTSLGDGISAGWDSQNFNIFGGIGATKEYFAKKRQETVTIKFYDEGTGFFDPPSDSFVVGQKIHQGEFGPDQARGTVTEWNTNYSRLKVKLDNGTFRTGTAGEIPTSVTGGCILYGETSGTAYTGGGIYESLLTFRTGSNEHPAGAFSVNDTVYKSGVAAKVLGWTGGTYGQLLLGTTGGTFSTTTTSTSSPLRDETSNIEEIQYAGGIYYQGGGDDLSIVQFYTGGTAHENGAFAVNDKIHQGEYGPEQARGTVVLWSPGSGALFLRNDYGTFRTGTAGEIPTSVTGGCILYGETTGTAYTGGYYIQDLDYSKNLDIVAQDIIGGDASIMIVGDSINNPTQADYMWTGYAESWNPYYWRGHSIALSSGNSSTTGYLISCAVGSQISGYSMSNGPDPFNPVVSGTSFEGQQLQPTSDGIKMSTSGTNSGFSQDYKILNINPSMYNLDSGIFNWVGTSQSKPAYFGAGAKQSVLMFSESDADIITWWRFGKDGDGAGISVSSQVQGISAGWDIISSGIVDASSGTTYNGPSELIAKCDVASGETYSVGAVIIEDTSVTGIRLAYVGGGGFKTANHSLTGDAAPTVPGNDGRTGSYSDEAISAYMDAMETNIVWIHIGANDSSVEGYTDHIETLIQRYRNIRPGLRFVLVSQYDVSTNAKRWADQATFARNLAGSPGYEDVAFLDLRNKVISELGNYAGWCGDYLQDGTHPNETGATYFAKYEWDEIVNSANYPLTNGIYGGFITNVSVEPNYYNGGIIQSVDGPTGYSGGFVNSVSPSVSYPYVGTTLPGWPSNDIDFWIVHPHPNTWHGNIASGTSWGAIQLQDFIRTPYNITSPPVSGSSYGSYGTLGSSPSIPDGYGEGI